MHSCVHWIEWKGMEGCRVGGDERAGRGWNETGCIAHDQTEWNGTVVVLQSLSHVQLLMMPWTMVHQASMSFTVPWSLLKFMSIESVKPSNHLILCHPLLLLPSIFHSNRGWPFASGGQSTGASASASALAMNSLEVQG